MANDLALGCPTAGAAVVAKSFYEARQRDPTLHTDPLERASRSPAAAAVRGCDVHAHVLPPSVVDAAHAGLHGLQLKDDMVLVDDEAVPRGMLDPALLLRWLDERGLAGAAISVPPPLYRLGLPAANAAEWTALLNDGLEAVADASGGRLVALAHLPLPHADVAAAESRQRQGARWAGVALACAAPGLRLDDARLRSLWDALDGDSRFVLLHPPMGEPHDARLGSWHLNNLIGNPYETSLATAALVFSGLLERHRDMRVCLSHAGGATPILAGRWEHAVAIGHDAVPRLELSPAQALRRLFADSVAHSPSGLALALDVFGPSHILLGSDWPFPMGDLGALDGVSDTIRTPIAVENPARVLEVAPRLEVRNATQTRLESDPIGGDDDGALTVGPARLARYVGGIFAAAGCPQADAAAVAQALVDADTRGVMSHGCMLVPMYVERIHSGSVSAVADATVVVDEDALVVIDAHHALGVLTADRAMELAIERARDHGLGAVAVRHAFHFGAAARYVSAAAAAGMLGFAAANTRPLMPAPGGAKPVIGNNPIAFGVPSDDGEPLILDMALSEAALGKIRLAEQQGVGIPPNWAADRHGIPTTDPAAALKGMLLPTGGPKGFGLALIVEVLTGVLSGGAFGGDVQGLYADTRVPNDCSHFFLAVDLARFGSLELMRARVSQLAAEVAASPAAPGVDRVRLPGQIESERRAAACAHGLPISGARLAELRATATSVGYEAAL